MDGIRYNQAMFFFEILKRQERLLPRVDRDIRLWLGLIGFLFSFWGLSR